MNTSIAHADPILERADEFLKAGRADAASSIYLQYLKAHPDDVTSQLRLAQIAMRKFEYDKARNILEKTLAQHPDSPETAASLGRLLQLRSNAPAGVQADNSRDYHALAAEHFRQAQSLGQNSPLVLTYLAEWQIQQNDLVSAERNLNRALTLNPTFVPAFQGQARFYMKAKDLMRAKDAILHAIELDPNDSVSYFLSAQLLGIANRPREAVNYAEKSEQLDYGRSPERDYFLATQYEVLAMPEKAIRYYENLTAYTPKEAQVWMKLGQLYDSVNRPEQSLNAFRKALALKPEILGQMYVQARENTRMEKVELALPQWRQLLILQASVPPASAGAQAGSTNEAIGAIASLHYLNRFYHPDQVDSTITRDTPAVEAALQAAPDNAVLQLDRIKMQLAQQELTLTLRQGLQFLASGKDPAAAGEAAFLLGNYAQARQRLEEVDGLSEQEYTLWADRLYLDQELSFSHAFYQRAYELNRSATGLQVPMKRILAKQALATQKMNDGNLLFQDKKYAEALEKYLEASRIYQQWDNVYLRLGDTYEQLKLWKQAKEAYATAISLSPTLMDSPGFAKNYQKLSKRVGSSH